MNRNFRFSLSLATLLFLSLQPAVANAEAQKKTLSETDALEFLVQKVKSDSLYSAWTKIECLSFFVEETTESHFDIAVREKHGAKCPGDPNTAPIVDRFRVLRATKKILWHNITEDEYGNYDPKKIRR